MAADGEQLRLLEAEIGRLKKEIVILDREWARKYRLAWAILLAIPLYFFVGHFWAGIVIVATPALVATQAYLLAVRRAEARDLLSEAQGNARALKGGEPKPVPEKGS